MSAHTLGPWEVFPNYTSGQIDIGPIEHHSNLVRCVATFGMEDLPNAARIVACVNACEGMDGELLEPRMLGNQIAAKMAVIEERDALRAERDALRAALARLETAMHEIYAGTAKHRPGHVNYAQNRTLREIGEIAGEALHNPDQTQSAALAQGSEK